MEDIIIWCENSDSYCTVSMGTTLKQLAEKICPPVGLGPCTDLPVLAALVDIHCRLLFAHNAHRHA